MLCSQWGVQCWAVVGSIFLSGVQGLRGLCIVQSAAAFAFVHMLCADPSMQLSARSAVLPLGQAVLGSGWVHNTPGPEWCVCTMGFVYCVGCSWQYAFAVLSKQCVDLSMQLSARSPVMPMGLSKGLVTIPH